MGNYPTDLSEVKELFKAFLATNTDFKDFNFEASASSQIINVFAYLLQMQNFHLNMTTNELFISTADIENNIYKKAHELNYLPRRKVSPNIRVVLRRTGSNSIIIPQYTKFKMGDIDLVLLEEVSLPDDDPVAVDLWEGTIILETFISDGSNFQKYFLTEKKDIDNSKIWVYVDASKVGGGWTPSSDVWNNVNNDEFNVNNKNYFIEYFEFFGIKFDNGRLFVKPEEDELIRVQYLKTNGSLYNGSGDTITLDDVFTYSTEVEVVDPSTTKSITASDVSNFTLDGDITSSGTGVGKVLEIDSVDKILLVEVLSGDFIVDEDLDNTNPYVASEANLSLIINNVFSGGVEEESLESIKTNSPSYFTTQNRAITERDYNVLIKKYDLYELFTDTIAWGGEKEWLDGSDQIIESSSKKDLGHVYISTIKDVETYLTIQEQTNLIDFMNNYKILTIFMKFLHPNIVYIDATTNIKYKDIFGLDKTTTQTDLDDYLSIYIGFNKTFNKSNLAQYVDNLDGVEYSDISYILSVVVKDESYKVIRLNNAITAGSISATINALPLTDVDQLDGTGNLMHNSIQVGTITYATGFIIIDDNSGFGSPLTYEIDFDVDDPLSISFLKETMLSHKSVNIIEI